MTVVSWLSDGPGTHVPEDLKPALCNAASASVLVSPVIEGTVAWLEPEDTNTVTPDPLSTCTPAAGSVRVTWPLGTVSDASVCVRLTVRPALPKMPPASAGLLP